MYERPTKDELRMAEFMAEQQLASVVREACENSGLDRQEIATRLGVHRSNISKILNSPRNMTVRMAGRMLRAVGCRLSLGYGELQSKQAQAPVVSRADNVVSIRDYRPATGSDQHGVYTMATGEAIAL